MWWKKVILKWEFLFVFCFSFENIETTKSIERRIYRIMRRFQIIRSLLLLIHAFK